MYRNKRVISIIKRETKRLVVLDRKYAFFRSKWNWEIKKYVGKYRNKKRKELFPIYIGYEIIVKMKNFVIIKNLVAQSLRHQWNDYLHRNRNASCVKFYRISRILRNSPVGKLLAECWSHFDQMVRLPKFLTLRYFYRSPLLMRALLPQNPQYKSDAYDNLTLASFLSNIYFNNPNTCASTCKCIYEFTSQNKRNWTQNLGKLKRGT